VGRARQTIRQAYQSEIKESENDRSVYAAPPLPAAAVAYARVAADIDRTIKIMRLANYRPTARTRSIRREAQLRKECFRRFNVGH